MNEQQGPVPLTGEQAVQQVIHAMTQLGQTPGPLDEFKIKKLIEQLYANQLVMVWFPKK